MKIYKIYATTIKGEYEKISPMAVNTNKEEMIKIAKRMKYDMKEYYKKVELREDEYKYIKSEFIDI